MISVGIIGAGAWGTVVANMLADNGHRVVLWCYAEHIATGIANDKAHHRLPGIELSAHIQVTTTMSDCYGHDLLILGLSSSQLVAHDHAIDWSAIQCPVVGLAKGIIEPKWFISEWVQERLNGVFGVLSGPNLALEIAQKKPSASVIASSDDGLNQLIQNSLSNHYFRVYTSRDIRGVECGGIFKNVFAIAAGCIDGLDLGDNAKSALITRGLVELQRLLDYFDADPSTALGLSGLGDLIATCSSKQSRNWQLGFRVVTTPNHEEWEQSHRGETEGVRTIRLMHELMVKESLNLPIMMAVGRLFQDSNAVPSDIIQDLMKRGLKSEFDPCG